MAQSPLLTSLIWIARFHGSRVIAESVLTGLTASADSLTAEHIERATAKAGLLMFTKPLTGQGLLEDICPPSCLPCIAWLESSPVVVVKVEKEYVELRRPELDMSLERLNADLFLKGIEDKVVFFSRASAHDDRDPDYPNSWREHWLWGSSTGRPAHIS